ncbi:hypothetical protein [Chitinilyticum litopenaei]|uniref:hypothetical protein n=1 Tax=Chitinilyticum litopenaei TaxID=1121276 RepID=UPI0011864455|nr:hypothetical protein [Chitinilyticum litopenaei]
MLLKFLNLKVFDLAPFFAAKPENAGRMRLGRSFLQLLHKVIHSICEQAENVLLQHGFAIATR